MIGPVPSSRGWTHLALTLVAMLVALPIAGCGSDATPNTSTIDEAHTTASPPSSSALIDALKRSKIGSRERTIYALYYYARFGDYPALVRLYDNKVRVAIGRAAIASLYADNRGRFLSVGLPKIVNSQPGAQGVSVAIQLPVTDGSVIEESYVLRRRPGGWGIVYDTFFDRAYGEEARLRVDPPGSKPSARGARLARLASSRFRNLSL